MKLGIIVQARLGSTRLPGKVLLKILDKTILEILIERLSQVIYPHDVIIAIPVSERDDSLEDFVNSLGVKCFRGSEEDVLARSYFAAKEASFDTVVRITSDCPLIDPEIIDQSLNYFFKERGDYFSNTLKKTVPRGMDVEVFTFKALEKAYFEASNLYEREHVTPYIYRHPDLFRILVDESGLDLTHYRLTLDTEEDFRLIRAIFETLYPENPTFRLRDIISLLCNHPDWINWNKDVRQKHEV